MSTNSIHGRLVALERRFTVSTAKPGLVLFVDGELTPGQEIACAAATADDRQIILIERVDGRRQPEARSGVDEGGQG
jgi:hypothetical protein